VVVDSYDETNQDATSPVGDATNTGVGQSFTSKVPGKLSEATFYLSKTLVPTGNATAVLYALADALGGGDDVPSGAALATSDPLDVSTLTGSLVLTTFTFPDGPVLDVGENYFIAVEYSGGDVSNYVNVGTDTSAAAHDGNEAIEAGGWTATAATDVVFFVRIADRIYAGMDARGYEKALIDVTVDGPTSVDLQVLFWSDLSGIFVPEYPDIAWTGITGNEQRVIDVWGRRFLVSVTTVTGGPGNGVSVNVAGHIRQAEIS
jgi:hypothetical protein